MVEANNNDNNNQNRTTGVDDKMTGVVEESKEPVGSSTGEHTASDSHVL